MIRTNAPKAGSSSGRAPRGARHSPKAPRTETDAAKVSVNEEGLSGDVTSKFIEDLMATSPVALATNECVARRRYRHFGDASDVQVFHAYLDTSPRGVRKVRETFRFIFKPWPCARTCRAAPRLSLKPPRGASANQ